jgi:hypothetical protein
MSKSTTKPSIEIFFVDSLDESKYFKHETKLLNQRSTFERLCLQFLDLNTNILAVIF